MADTLHDRLVACLAEARALEGRGLALLRRAVSGAGDEEMAVLYREHAAETEEHERLIQARLEAHGARASRLRDLAAKAGAAGSGLLSAGTLDSAGRVAAHVYAFEHLEIATYQLLRRLAAVAGDEETVRVTERILESERAVAHRIGAHFDAMVCHSLAERGLLAEPAASAAA